MAHLLDDAYLRPFEGAIRGRAERADRLARARDARAYGSGPRSSLTARALTARDAAVLCIALAAVRAVAVLL